VRLLDHSREVNVVAAAIAKAARIAGWYDRLDAEVWPVALSSCVVYMYAKPRSELL
jgi:hypothetical protein